MGITKICCAFHFFFHEFYIALQPIAFDIVIVVLLSVIKKKNYYYYYYYYQLQLGCYPVAVVILHVYKI